MSLEFLLALISDEDRTTYLDLLAEQGGRYGIQFLAWCLMTNHVHLIVVPLHERSLAKGIGKAHKRYTRSINFREGARGYLFQGRFFSCPCPSSQCSCSYHRVHAILSS